MLPGLRSLAAAMHLEIHRVYIERHLDEPLTLEQLSEVANFSRYHFHRQFANYCGIPVGRYIQLMRLKRASYRLAFNPLEKIIDIALDAGFQNPESFSRAFKQSFGLTPSQFRKQPAWINWYQRIPKHIFYGTLLTVCPKPRKNGAVVLEDGRQPSSNISSIRTYNLINFYSD